MLKVKGVLSDTVLTPSRVWEVSPGFTFNSYRRTSPTIQQAITAIDSGVIYVYPGIYSERITGKSRVLIMGASRDRVKLQRTDDSCVVYANGVSNFGISNMTIQNLYSSNLGVQKNVIKLYQCNNTDSTSAPTLIFDNLYMSTQENDQNVAVVYLDSSKAEFRNCYMTISASSGMSACIWQINGAKVSATRSKFKNLVDAPLTGIFMGEDDRCRLWAGYNEMQINGSSGSIIMGFSDAYHIRAYYNVSDYAFTGGSAILLMSNNTYDADFYIP